MTDTTPTPEQMIELEKDFCLVGLMLRGLAYEDAERKADEWIKEARDEQRNAPF